MKKHIWIGLALAALMAGGCAYRSLYFKRSNDVETRIDRFVVKPRVFSYKWEERHDTALSAKGFYVSVRVEDPEVQNSSETWRQDASLIDSLSEAFRERLAGIVRIDSLVLHPLPIKNEPILLFYDEENLSPRRDGYLTLQFGAVDIPPASSWVRLVLHHTLLNGPEPTTPDSTVWQMYRVARDARELRGARPEAEGYD